LHEREQLGIYELFIDVNKPLKIDETIVGISISISWLKKFDHDNGNGFNVFDVGIILNVHYNTVQICFQRYEKSYNGNCHELPYSSYEPVILEKD
jgi:hypothetical protein